MAGELGLSREDLLGGQVALERRAARLLGTIEARVSHMRNETHLAVEALFSGRHEEFTRTFGDDYLRSLKLGARHAEPPRLADIERFAHQWRGLVPHEPELRAALIRLLSERYQASSESAPAALAAAGLGEVAVAEAYQRLFADRIGAPPGALPPPAPGSAEPADPESAARAEAEAALEWLSLPAGTVVIREGDQPDFLYFIVSGRLRVLTGSRVIADLGRGELVGEIGVLTGEPRTANVIALRDSEVVRLPQAAVLRMAYQSPQMLLRVNQILATRLRVELKRRRWEGEQLTLALVPARPGLPLSQLAQRMVSALETIAPVSLVSYERARALFPRLGAAGADPANDAELLAWLSEQESLSHFVLFQAGDEPGPWTDLCIRQADRIGLVAAANDSPAPTAAEARIAAVNPAARLDLVLLHPHSGATPRGTGAWLANRQVAAHHHVAPGDQATVASAARRMSGMAVGLVLGGGGARGYAHIGAWRALCEAGVPVDIVGGTSVGAIMAAGIVTGRDPAEIEELGRSFAEGGIMDFTLPVVSFFESRKLSRLLHRYTPGLIEDLWKPFFAISTSLSRAEPVVHERGPLWRAARASSAIPGLFAPVVGPGGDLLVDGASLNNLPVDVMRARCERGPVIAINLSPPLEDMEQYRLGAAVSGWRVLWDRLNPRGGREQVPWIFTTLLRSNEVGSTYRMKRDNVTAAADLVINPDVEHFGRLDFRKYRRLVEIGYEATREALQTWFDEAPDLRRRFATG